MKAWLNIIIQILNISVALIPNLVYPALFGLAYHGEFLRIIALPVFIIFLISLPFDNLLMKEMAARPGLGLWQCSRILLWNKLVLATILFLCLSFWTPSRHLLLQIFFLNSAGLSSFFLSALYAHNDKHKIVFFLTGFTLISLTSALWVFWMQKEAVVLASVTIFINLVSTGIAILLLVPRWTGPEKPDISSLRIASFMILSAPVAILSYGIVAIAGNFLVASRLSLLRIFISVAQAATTFFPVNQRTILENLVSLSTDEERKNRYQQEKVAEYFRSALWLVALSWFAILLFIQLVFLLDNLAFLPGHVSLFLTHYKSEIIIMAPAIPLFLLGSLLEKVIISLLPERQGSLYGFVATFLIITMAIAAMSFLPRGGFIAYLLTSGLLVAVATGFIGIAGISDASGYQDLARGKIARDTLMLAAFLAAGQVMLILAETVPVVSLFVFVLTVMGATGMAGYLWIVQQKELIDFIRR